MWGVIVGVNGYLKDNLPGWWWHNGSFEEMNSLKCDSPL